MPRYELTVSGYFEAALRVDCGRRKDDSVHGRRFDVEVTVSGEKLNRLGMLMDERKLRKKLCEALAELDHCFLNELPEFAGVNPTAENVATLICGRMTPLADKEGLEIAEVQVRLHPGAFVRYRP